MELGDDVVIRRRRESRSLCERVEVLAHREAFHLGDQRVERRLRAGQRVVIPRRRGLGRQVERERPIAAADRGRREIDVPVEGEVEHRREQHDAVDADALTLQRVHQHRRARRAVRLAEQELRRVPAAERRDVAVYELAERANVGIDAEEVARLPGRSDAAEAGVGRVDEDEVGAVEQRVLVLDQVERRVGRRLRVADDHAHRSERPHPQPDRRAARAAVVEERHRPRARIHAVGREGRVEHAARDLALVVLQRDRAGTRRVGIDLPAQGDGVLGHRIRRGARRRRRGRRARRRSRRGTQQCGGQDCERDLMHGSALPHTSARDRRETARARWDADRPCDRRRKSHK